MNMVDGGDGEKERSRLVAEVTDIFVRCGHCHHRMGHYIIFSSSWNLEYISAADANNFNVIYLSICFCIVNQHILST